MRLGVDFMIHAYRALKEESTTDKELVSIINQYLPRVDLIREQYEKIEERAGSRQSGTKPMEYGEEDVEEYDADREPFI